MDTYRLEIIKHYKNPQNYGKLKNANAKSKQANISCGDNIQIEAIIENNIIKDIKFTGEGCAISVASASMLTEKVKKMKTKDIKNLKLKDIEKLLNIKISKAR